MATIDRPTREERKLARQMRTPAERQRRFAIHFVVYLAVITGLGLMNYNKNPDNLWFLWVAGGWGIGIVAHAIKAFGSSHAPLEHHG